eukprot:6065329-Amphidinium_carterae.1
MDTNSRRRRMPHTVFYYPVDRSLRPRNLVATGHRGPCGLGALQTWNRRTPGLHLLFDTVDEVTAETVMVVPLYILGIFKSWAEQMEWNDLPSRVMDV